ncbi:MAG: BamA/TamA family outer membrane protein [Campylobacterota bacterium]|nr:BamA/TamA family outer membrane protein [Campylobacterota bacterium]
MKTLNALLLLPLLLFSLHANEEIQTEEPNLFTSKEDGTFDVSEYLGTQYGFMPVPTIITEPALGYGAGISLMFLHDTFNSTHERKSPPSISGLFLGGTENGTRAAGAFHLGFWKEDTIRSTTFVGAMDVNINFYLRNTGIDMKMKGFFGYQELMFRLGGSDFFLGANYIYSNVESSRNDTQFPILNPLFEHQFKMAGLATILQYDTRDSIFTPSQGLFAKATLRRFDENLGGKENFWRYGAKALYFIPALRDTLTIGVRVEGESVNAIGDDIVPFFANPSINMRGIPAMRYQGEKMLLSELQVRWEFIERWNLVLFDGAGYNGLKNQDNFST